MQRTNENISSEKDKDLKIKPDNGKKQRCFEQIIDKLSETGDWKAEKEKLKLIA